MVVIVIICISVREQCFAIRLEKSVANDSNGNMLYTTTRSYNDQNKVTEVKTVDIKNKILVDYTYGYDTKGNVINEKDNLAGRYKEFQFDSYNQLVSEKYYDDLGKLTQEINYKYANKGTCINKTISHDNALESTDYQYNEKSQITKVNNQDYKYDEDGNLVQDGRKTNTFDSKGELIQVKQDSKTIETYQYNQEGERVKKASDGLTEVYTYSEGQLIAITDAKGKPEISFTRDTDGKLVSMTDNQNMYWYLLDGLGNVKGLADKDGTKVVSYEYDAFGNCTESQGSDVRTVNPFMFMGYQHDDTTGYYYLGARYYDPATGRFISADGYTGDALITSNLYRYANNNPLKYKDSSGHWNESIDSKLPDWAQTEIHSLTAQWSSATTNEAKDRIHAKANSIRAYAEKQNPTTLKGISVAFTVKYDSTGDDVRSLQQALKDTGKIIAIDGQFRSNTYVALCQYQGSNSLFKDGIAGINTWAKLGEVYYGDSYSKLHQVASNPDALIANDTDTTTTYNRTLLDYTNTIIGDIKNNPKDLVQGVADAMGNGFFFGIPQSVIQFINGYYNHNDNIAYYSGRAIGDIISMYGGVATTTIGSGEEVGGVLLDCTAIGAILGGIELNIAGSTTIAYGGTVAVVSAGTFASDTNILFAKVGNSDGSPTIKNMNGKRNWVNKGVDNHLNNSNLREQAGSLTSRDGTKIREVYGKTTGEVKGYTHENQPVEGCPGEVYPKHYQEKVGEDYRGKPVLSDMHIF